MLFIIYEQETGVVVSCVDRPEMPVVMGHHDVVEYPGDAAPDLDTVRVTEDGAVEAIVPDLETVRDRALSAVNRKRDIVQRSGCATPKGVMQSDSESRLMLSGAIQMAQIAMSQGQPFEMGWTMMDNVTVDHDAVELITAGVAMGLFISRAHSVAVALKEAINAAQTVEDIEGIDIEGASWIV